MRNTPRRSGLGYHAQRAVGIEEGGCGWGLAHGTTMIPFWRPVWWGGQVPTWIYRMDRMGVCVGAEMGGQLRTEKPPVVRVSGPPMVPPLRRGDGRNILRPYGLTRTYPVSRPPLHRRAIERGSVPEVDWSAGGGSAVRSLACLRRERVAVPRRGGWPSGPVPASRREARAGDCGSCGCWPAAWVGLWAGWCWVPCSAWLSRPSGLLVGGAAVGAIGGAVLGVLQWLVLRRQLARAGWWIEASTVGWAVGGAAFGLAGGAVAGFLQWLVLRRRLARAGWWIAASTVGWAIGPVIVLFGGVIGELDAVLIVLLVGALWGIGGVVGGAITGTVLVWLLRQRLVDADGAVGVAARAEAMGG